MLTHRAEIETMVADAGKFGLSAKILRDTDGYISAIRVTDESGSEIQRPIEFAEMMRRKRAQQIRHPN